jgi:hypothetical protein
MLQMLMQCTPQQHVDVKATAPAAYAACPEVELLSLKS